MLKPTESIARALCNLENNVSWEEVIGWINKSFLSQAVRNNHLTGEATIKGQGRCLELEEILKYSRTARELLNHREEK